MTRPDAIIVGGGHNGLVCAAYLARSGINVVVLEANESVGGMAAPRTVSDDYHFPGLPLAVAPISKAIRKDLQLERFGYQPGSPVSTISLGADGQHVEIDRDRVSGETLAQADAETWPEFRREYLAFANSLRPLLANRPPRLKDMPFGDKLSLAKLGWKIRFGLGRDSMYEFLRVAAINIHDVLNDTFVDERLKAAVALDAIMGNAMGPRTPGTVLTWLRRLHDELEGSPTLHSGEQLVNALTQSAEDAGARVRCNAKVARILVHDDKAFGVELEDGEIIKSKVVVSNVDARRTFLSLVGAPQLDTMFTNRVGQIRGKGVVAKLHIALSGLPEFDGLDAARLGSRLLVAPSMRYIERAFNHAKYGECSDEPVLEISTPSTRNPSLAPDGHHVMAVNVAYMPYDLEGGWEDQKTTAAYRIISLLGRYAPNLKSLIVDHEFLTPADIEREFGAVEGHWHHGELSIHQSFMMRPLHGAAQHDTPIGKLFLCGASCHPGGGLTGLPGRNAARRILELGGAK
jgi:phytoene dehydrogenase-like protein